MKTIYAVRVAGDLYDCTYSDGVDTHRMRWADVVEVARTQKYGEVRINNQSRGEGELVSKTIAMADLNPHSVGL